MNYYGINRKVEVQRTNWAGPKARVEQRKADALLDEIVYHTIEVPNVGGSRRPPDDYVLERLFSKYRSAGLECRTNMENPYEFRLELKGTKRDMIAEFGEDYEK